jgi:hypothetical protein
VNAKTHIIMTFSGFLAMGVFTLVVVLLGLDWRGGNEGIWWFLFAGSVMTFAMHLIYKKKLPMAKWGMKSVLAFDRHSTIEEAVDLCQKYSFLLLIASIVLLLAGIASLFIY